MGDNGVMPLIVNAYNKNPLSEQLIGCCYIDLTE